MNRMRVCTLIAFAAFPIGKIIAHVLQVIIYVSFVVWCESFLGIYIYIVLFIAASSGCSLTAAPVQRMCVINPRICGAHTRIHNFSECLARDTSEHPSVRPHAYNHTHTHTQPAEGSKIDLRATQHVYGTPRV